MRDGDIITLDYEGHTDGELFDTTLEKAAKDAGTHEEGRPYGPITVIIGEGRLVPGLEAALKKAKVGEASEATLPPEEAYGQRDPKLIETMSRTRFSRTCPDAKGYPGEELEIEGRHAHLVAIYGARVRVDFNQHLAGKELVFKFTIKSKVSKPPDKITALFDMEYPSGDEPQVKLYDDVRHLIKSDTGKRAEITLPDRCKFDPAWFQAKYRVVAALRKHTDLEEIIFIESYEGTKPEKKEAKKKKAPAKKKKTASKKRAAPKKKKAAKK
mgnify:CR=1 FL=1